MLMFYFNLKDSLNILGKTLIFLSRAIVPMGYDYIVLTKIIAKKVATSQKLVQLGKGSGQTIIQQADSFVKSLYGFSHLVSYNPSLHRETECTQYYQNNINKVSMVGQSLTRKSVGKL